MNYTPNLGAAPDSNTRDAVHIAVLPVKLDAPWKAGEHAALTSLNGLFIAVRPNGEQKAVGIIDPFRTDPLFAGYKAWLFLYPGTIQSLRHEWTHPVLDDVLAKEAALEVVLRTASMCNVSHLQLMHAAERAVKGEVGGWNDAAIVLDNQDYDSVSAEEWIAFWSAFETLTGLRKQSTSYEGMFSCAC